MSRQMTIDFTADAAYVPVLGRDGAFAKTRHLTPAVLADLDSSGGVIGVEVIGLKADIPIEQLREMGVPEVTLYHLLLLRRASFESTQSGSLVPPTTEEQQP